MNVFRKVIVTVQANVETIVASIQNRDALAKASLEDLASQIQSAHAAQRALQRGLEKNEALHATAVDNTSSWKERARQSAAKGETDTGLECLKRSKQAQQSSVLFEQQQKKSLESSKRLQQAIGELTSAHARLTLKRQQLKAEQSLRVLEPAATKFSTSDTEAILNDWEDSLTEFAPTISMDSWEQSFVGAEERANLERELADLIKT